MPQVFDSGLIGEGVLHILAAAREKLAAPGALLVPASARVYAQPIQMRLESAAGFDVSQANRWRWRPDYEGVNLEECRWVEGVGGRERAGRVLDSQRKGSTPFAPCRTVDAHHSDPISPA